MKHTHFVMLFAFLFASILNAQNSKISLSAAPNSKIDKIEKMKDVKPASNYYQASSQNVIEIGDGTLVSERYPVYAYFGYSYTQTIYLQSEIGYGDTISKIWYYFDGANLDYSNNWTIYLGHTSKSVFDSYADWIPVSELIQVYSATFGDPGAPGWIEFDIDEFVYNGTDNLVIAVDENADDYNSSTDRFYCTDVSASGLRSLAVYDDIDNPDPSAPIAADQLQAIIPNIRLLMGAPPAHDLGVSKITPVFVKNGETVAPKITVRNYGTQSESNWGIKLTDSLGYDEVVVDPGLIAAGEDFIVSFPDWTPSAGIQELVASVILLTDENEGNNILSGECNVMDFVPGYVSVYDNNTSVISNGVLSIPADQYIPWGESEMIRGFALKEDTLFAVTAYGDFGIIDTADGSFNYIGATGVICTFYTNLAIDPNTGEIYLLALSGSYPDFSIELYTIETATGLCTLVDTASHAGTVAMMAFDNNSNLYVIEHVSGGNGNLYTMDESTAEMSLIGDMGGIVSSKFQAMAWDFENEVMYFQASTSTLGEMQGSYSLNLATGAATLVGVPFSGQVMAMTIPQGNITPKYSVNFNVDMNELITFDNLNQEVYLSGGAVGDIGSIGSSARWSQPGTDSDFLMSDEDENGIYSLSITGVDTGSYEYKYFWVNSGTPAWTNGNPASNKSFSVVAENVELNDVWEVTHVAVENLNPNSEVGVYPNPSAGVFTFTVKGEYEANVYDLAGNLVYTSMLKDLNNKIDLTNQQAGMYFIKLIGEKTFNLKVIKE